MNSNRFFLLVFLFFSMALKAEKYALLIGVGDYPSAGGWQNLAGANDVLHMQAALRLHGFSSDNCRSLVNQEATKANIVKIFNKLTAEITAGDIVFIHLSGHGQQIPDKNGDEPDQLDEAFVPYDSPKQYKVGIYEGERLLLDDEINELTYAIRKKLGNKGQLLFILDSCHSGTGNRGLGRARGTDLIMAPESYEAFDFPAESFEGAGYNNDRRLAPMGSFFGSSAQELNYEVVDDQLQPVGSLSYTVATLLAKLQGPMSFQDFFKRIQTRMKALVSQQHPQWEGPKSAFLFGQNNSQFKTTYAATCDSENQVSGQVGTICGVHRGTKVAIYSTNKARGTIAQGIVRQADMMQSIIQLDTAIKIAENEDLLIRIQSPTEPPIKSHIALQLSDNSPWKAVSDSLKQLHFIETMNEHADLFLSDKAVNGALQLLTKEGILLTEIKELTEEQALYELMKYIKAYTQGKFLRAYENNDAFFQFSITLLSAREYTDKHNLPPALGDTLTIGTEIHLAIKNEGSKGAYFSLLDIQPDNQLNVLIPVESLGHLAKDFYLQPGAVYVTDYTLEIGEPIGEETLKLICTEQPLDISSIIQQNGSTTRGSTSLHPFEQALIYSYQNESSRGTITKPGLEEVGISTLNFRIER